MKQPAPLSPLPGTGDIKPSNFSLSIISKEIVPSSKALRKGHHKEESLLANNSHSQNQGIASLKHRAVVVKNEMGDATFVIGIAKSASDVVSSSTGIAKEASSIEPSRQQKLPLTIVSKSNEQSSPLKGQKETKVKNEDAEESLETKKERVEEIQRIRRECLELLITVPSDDSLYSDTDEDGDERHGKEDRREGARRKSTGESVKKKKPKKKPKKDNPEPPAVIFNGGSPPNKPVSEDIKQLHRACQYGQLATVAAILDGLSPKMPHIPELGLDVDAHGNTSLHVAAQHDQLLIVKLLLRHCHASTYIAMQNEAGLRASQVGSRRTSRLISAFEARWSNTSSLRASVLAGSYSALNSNYTEPGLLHDAAVRDDVRMVRDICRADRLALNALWHGRTALHDAALLGSLDAVAALLNLGALPSLRDADGRLPFELSDKLTRRHFRKWSRRNDMRYIELFEEPRAGGDPSSLSISSSEDNSIPQQMDDRESRKLAQALSIINRQQHERSVNSNTAMHASNIPAAATIRPSPPIVTWKRRPGRPRKHPKVVSDDEEPKRQPSATPHINGSKRSKLAARTRPVTVIRKPKKLTVPSSSSSKSVETNSKKVKLKKAVEEKTTLGKEEGQQSVTTSELLPPQHSITGSRLPPKMKMKMMHRASLAVPSTGGGGGGTGSPQGDSCAASRSNSASTSSITPQTIVAGKTEQ